MPMSGSNKLNILSNDVLYMKTDYSIGANDDDNDEIESIMRSFKQYKMFSKVYSIQDESDVQRYSESSMKQKQRDIMNTRESILMSMDIVDSNESSEMKELNLDFMNHQE
eukprot:CAMPEP_0114664780 /NCGR_PEP_ID=MMETSP0191-20121206/29428_1 /TAXON_ID=126664 /ORGANISM="Sorites sp." /LENGTH=109 /DNA_ID=CAMNT_0001907821 /DNA_START=293 /DNA_END=622 /DNA_ORIENTATION=-